MLCLTTSQLTILRKLQLPLWS